MTAVRPGPVDRRVLVTSTRKAERVLEVVRNRMARALDGVQLRLRALEVKLDPDTERWEQEVRAAIADGTIAKQLEKQPSPEEILEQRHRATTS